jgi:ectoine hydroxylase-related dioxygenase (phytanoyl-CoA dioxygenase family)
LTPTRASIGAAAAQHWLQRLAPLPGASLKLAQALDLHDLLRTWLPLRAVVQDALGGAPWCLADQCWVRRARPPHHWHQDGGLHHDYLNQPLAGALLPMVTCWIALTPCGDDAPGLEWVEPALPQLLPPAELTDSAVHARFPETAFHRPRLAAGDALVFGGGLLHRTHATAAMTRPRTSIECRFCAHPPPPRLAAEPLLAWV